MRRAASGLGTDLTSRIAELERASPEWQPWLAMLREAARAQAGREWSRAVRLDQRSQPAQPGPDDPLLHGRAVTVDPAPLLRLTRRLARAAGDAAGLDGFHPAAEDVPALIEGTVRESGEPGAVRSVSELLAAGVLRVCASALADQVPAPWPHGYCPICGAWPVMAELRGMDRARRLRCGRCAGDWQMVWLRCAYCGEAEHDRLLRLAPEGALESRFVEACAGCRRYLKCSSTLTPLTPIELVLRDLETVELDLAALDRGYQRPQGSGFPVSLRVTARR